MAPRLVEGPTRRTCGEVSAHRSALPPCGGGIHEGVTHPGARLATDLVGQHKASRRPKRLHARNQRSVGGTFVAAKQVGEVWPSVAEQQVAAQGQALVEGKSVEGERGKAVRSHDERAAHPASGRRTLRLAAGSSDEAGEECRLIEAGGGRRRREVKHAQQCRRLALFARDQQGNTVEAIARSCEALRQRC